MERDMELKKRLESTSRNVLKIIRKTAKKFKIKAPENIEPFKKILNIAAKYLFLLFPHNMFFGHTNG